MRTRHQRRLGLELPMTWRQRRRIYPGRRGQKSKGRERDGRRLERAAIARERADALFADAGTIFNSFLFFFSLFFSILI